MTFRLARLSDDDVAQIGARRYPPPYDTYDVDADDAGRMTAPGERFWGVWDGSTLIAYANLGAEARVQGLEAATATEDLGVGLRPDLMGRGISRTLLPWLIDVLSPEIGGDDLRVVILDWNARSLAAYRRAGFIDSGSHRNERSRYELLILQRTASNETKRTDRDV